ncbi:hypothetical protein [Endozoicomonas sp. YOMI1]|uniref:hypothetical protein n=1 Tax=Endozoicomonas sp. YOMI1 TaxID=2828739 RepID=UPI00214807F7|nr:hypothetical protein [Endozoicomonas sp. YOMI1]
MDTITSHPELPDLSGQTPAHKSTQTDLDAGSSGSLGPYEISRVDEVVMFTGCLSDKEITVEKGRVVVKIHPALNVTAQDEGNNSKSFSIRFHSLPVNQASVNVTEAGGEEDFDWDDYAECVNLNNNESISVNTAFGSQISRDPGANSHSAVHVHRVIRQSVLPAVSEDSVSSDASFTEGFVTDSALAVTSSSPCRESHYSTDSNSSSLNSASNSLFKNGRKICEIAEMMKCDPHRSKDPVFKVMFSRLINYDVSKAPAWYKIKYANRRLLITKVENFILKSLANGMGCFNANDKDMHRFTGSANLSSYPLSSKFVYCYENNINIFEHICEAVDLFTNVESGVYQCFRGSSKINILGRTELYETLSFNESNEKSIKSKSRSGDLQLLSDCSSAIFFFFSNFISKLGHAIESKKYKTEKAAIARKIAKHTVLEKERGDFDLLNACVNYNLAVRLIEREYGMTVLARYDSERRAGEQDVEFDYSVEPGDLDVIKQLLVLIDALEEEGRAIISDYKTSIDALPRVVEGKRFEERVLHMFDNGSGYASKPLQGIKSTLTTILENHPANLSGYRIG